MEPRRFVSMRQNAAPPLAATARELGALRASVVDAAGISGAIWFSYLMALFYLLVSASAVTHRDLFLENPVRLPFLNVELPLRGFFWLAPALFVILAPPIA